MFLHINKYLGRIPDIPYDHPISLVNKIVFQLDNNIERAPRYFVNHYIQLDLYFGDFLQKNYPEYLSVEQQFLSYSLIPGKERKKVDWLKSNPQFTATLKQLENALLKSLFEKVFLSLINFLTGPHKLSRHKKEIEFYTQLLVATYRLNGHSEKQVNGYITRILSGDRYTFPFPLSFYKRNNDNSFEKITEEFLNTRDFKKQFDGFRNLLLNHEQRSGYFIFAIDNVAVDKKAKKMFSHRMDKVTLINPGHAVFRKLRASVKQIDRESKVKMYHLFFSKNKLLAYVQINFEDKAYSNKKAAKIIQDELGLLNEYINSNLELNHENYLFSEQLDTEYWSGNRTLMKKKIHHIYGLKLGWLSDHPFELLRNITFQGKDHFLHNEKTISRALKEDDVTAYWQYIENLYWFQNSENENIRKKFVNLLMNNLTQFTDILLLNIGHIFYYERLSKFNTEISDDIEVVKKICLEVGYHNNSKFPIGKYRTSIKHTFLRTVISQYLETKSLKHSQQWQKHFSSLVLELQEFRNAQLHSGHGNTYSLIKLTDLMPEIMNTARWTITKACVKNKKTSFSDLMENISS